MRGCLKFSLLSVCLLISPCLSATVFAEESGEKNQVDVPKWTFLLSGSPSEDEESSQLYGAELQLNWRFNSPFVVGFHGMIQKQDYDIVDTSRWGLGLSLNYYFDKLGSYRPYIAIKRTYYGGFGQTQDALDCTYCSDVEEEYSGGETFATIGTIINRWVIQLDVRISDDRSEWSQDAYDPYGVGATYYNSARNIPDPDFLFHVGYSW